jgi:capsid protein
MTQAELDNIAFAPTKGMHPLTGEPRQVNRVAKHLHELAQKPSPRVRASYDAAQTNSENRNYWANADHFDADSANCQSVRETLVARSRYEVANNGYSDGIAQAYCNSIVGKGPTLRMQTGSENFNRMVEAEWYRWTQAVGLRRKLWCMAHAKHTDGEAFAVIRRNPRLKHRVKIDLVLYETDHFRTPSINGFEDGEIDGLRFDEFGNVETYNRLLRHPGSNTYYGVFGEAEQIPADFVLHWFKLRRPGQHRGVPECASTLNAGAAARRYREATIAAAELVADFTMFIKTTFAADDSPVANPFEETEIKKRMLTALPEGYDAFQPKAEQPTSTYGEFNKSLIAEQARPKCMPYNVAAADSSGHSYASGRLDHHPYHQSLDVDREDGNDLVLNKLFARWFEIAVFTYGWLGGDPDAIGNIEAAMAHSWDWPKHPVADLQAEASSNQVRLQTGALTLTKLYADAGEDFEDELIVMASNYGVTPDEMRTVLMQAVFNAQNQQASMEQAANTAATKTAAAVAAIFAGLVDRLTQGTAA